MHAVHHTTNSNTLLYATGADNPPMREPLRTSLPAQERPGDAGCTVYGTMHRPVMIDRAINFARFIFGGADLMIRREDEPYPGTVLSAHQPYHLPPVCGYCADVKEGYPLIPARESPRVPPCINTVYHGRRRECRSSHTNDPRMPKPRHSRHHPFLFCGARGERWPSPAGARGITHAIQVTFFLQDEPAREREILWLCKAIAAYFLKKTPSLPNPNRRGSDRRENTPHRARI